MDNFFQWQIRFFHWLGGPENSRWRGGWSSQYLQALGCGSQAFADRQSTALPVFGSSGDIRSVRVHVSILTFITQIRNTKHETN